MTKLNLGNQRKIPFVNQLNFEPIIDWVCSTYPTADALGRLRDTTTINEDRLNDGVGSTYPIPDSLGRSQDTSIINEDGLYDVIFESRKPEAKRCNK